MWMISVRSDKLEVSGGGTEKDVDRNNSTDDADEDEKVSGKDDNVNVDD